MTRASVGAAPGRALLAGLAVLAAVGAACGPPEPELALFEVAAPRALSACQNPPATGELSAELWVSGQEESCPLDVDPADRSVSGSCTVTARAVRTLTLDWFTVEGGVRVLLAQAREELDLVAPASEEVMLAVTDEDVTVRDCVDVTGDDKVNGEATVVFGGAEVPVCDLDDSCAGAPADDEACANLGEVCAGEDPLVP